MTEMVNLLEVGLDTGKKGETGENKKREKQRKKISVNDS